MVKKQQPTEINVGIDLGFSELKLFDGQNLTRLLARVALAQNDDVSKPMGIDRLAKGDTHEVSWSGGQTFLVGQNAHMFSHAALEFNSIERWRGENPVIRALFYALMGKAQLTGLGTEASVWVEVGVPINSMDVSHQLKTLFEGKHIFFVDDGAHIAQIEKVFVSPQALGALAESNIPPKASNCVISIGSNTIEIVVTENAKVIPKFTTSTPLGVSQCLAYINKDSVYAMSELDEMARRRFASLPNADEAKKYWWARVAELFAKTFPNKEWRRFDNILTVGGGALMLRDELEKYFIGKNQTPEDPITSTAIGLQRRCAMRRAVAQ